MNTFIHISLLCSALILFICARAAWRAFTRPTETFQQQKTKEQYGYVPKAGDKKYIILTILLMLLVAMKSDAQVFGTAGFGGTNKFLSGELQVGYRISNSTISAGYTSVQFVSDQPVLFSVRGGHVIADKLHVYGGYVRVMYSSDDKSRNSNTWQVGAQYMFCFYDKGSFYIGSSYTGNKMISAHVGMTINLVRDY